MKRNDIVLNPSRPEWGLGKILDIPESTKALVFFEYAGQKKMLSAALALAEVQSPPAILERINNGTPLTGFRPLPDLIDTFLRQYPDGFQDAQYLEDERNYKVEASAFFHKHLGQESFLALLEANDYQCIVTQALRVVNKTNLIFPNEKMALRDGLAKAGSQAEFSRRLYDLLYGNVTESFDRFVSLLVQMDACKWTIATYFPFLLSPSEHIFVKPVVTRKAADAFAYDLDYHPRPCWRTYHRIQQFMGWVSEALGNHDRLSARDLIDVQSFVWCSQR